MIPVAFITDAGFLMQTGVAITSLIRNKNNDTVYDIFVIVSFHDENKINRLKSIPLDGSRLTVIYASTEKYNDIKQHSHIPIACLLKFDLCELIGGYDKILYVDGDVYIRGDLTRAYYTDLGDAHIGGVKSLEMCDSDQRLINAGVVLFNAKKMREDHMSKYLIQKRREQGDSGSMDQRVMNMVFGDEMVFLSYEYNCVANQIVDYPKQYTIQRLNSLYDTDYQSVENFLDNALIIHFASGSKPWKHSFLYGGDEWYKCYKTSVFSDDLIRRKGRFRVRVDAFFSAIKEEGIRGIGSRISHYAERITGKSKVGRWG